MSAIVAYYSLQGHTRLAAELLARDLGANLVEVTCTKPYPTKGFAKFLKGGRDALMGKLPEISYRQVDTGLADLVVLCFPNWADRPAPAIVSFIEKNSLKDVPVALVATSASGNSDKCRDVIAARLGRDVSQVPMLSLKEPKQEEAATLSTTIADFARTLEV